MNGIDRVDIQMDSHLLEHEGRGRGRCREVKDCIVLLYIPPVLNNPQFNRFER